MRRSWRWPLLGARPPANVRPCSFDWKGVVVSRAHRPTHRRPCRRLGSGSVRGWGVPARARGALNPGPINARRRLLLSSPGAAAFGRCSFRSGSRNRSVRCAGRVGCSRLKVPQSRGGASDFRRRQFVLGGDGEHRRDPFPVPPAEAVTHRCSAVVAHGSSPCRSCRRYQLTVPHGCGVKAKLDGRCRPRGLDTADGECPLHVGPQDLAGLAAAAGAVGRRTARPRVGGSVTIEQVFVRFVAPW